MRKNVTGRTVVIVVTILVCVFGIIGFPKSGAGLIDNVKHNIRLGLDLKGGSHLVLQVHVQDAVKTEADGAIERMKDELKKQSIDYACIDRNDPATVEDAKNIEIDVKGVPPIKTTAFRNMIAEHFSQWVLTPLNATDYRLTMRPSELVTLERDTVDRSLQTISNRINQLGLTEPTVQQYGQAGTDFEILVELPGVDDPARVRGNHADHRATGDRRREGRALPKPRRGPGAEGRHSAAGHQAGALQPPAGRRPRRVVPAGQDRP